MQQLIDLFFSQILPEFEFEVNFSVQLYASLTREIPVYLQITFHYVLKIYWTKKFPWTPSLGPNRCTGF